MYATKLPGLNWKYNSRYWTSGLRNSASDFKWCSSSAPLHSALWLKNEPNNFNETENCAQLVISKFNSSARLEDRHCGTVSAFACQVFFIIKY
jgi:Lectin C-type domain